MGILEPSVRKKLLKNIKDGKESYEEAVKKLRQLYDTRDQRCEAYLKAKEKYEGYVDKSFGGLAKLQEIKDDYKKYQALSKEQEKQYWKAVELAGDLLMKQRAADDELIEQTKSKCMSAIKRVQDANKELDDYLDKKADLKSKGAKKEYAEWKKVLRLNLFPKLS